MKKFILPLFGLLFTFAVFAQKKAAPIPPLSPTPFVNKVKSPPDPNYPEADWEVLKQLDMKSGKIGDKLKPLVQKKVRALGFMVPLDYDEKNIKEFLLIPNPMSCMHVPPPPPNQMILVKMDKGKKANYSWGPMWVKGVLVIPKKQKGVQDAPSFEMQGHATEEYKGADKATHQN